MIRAIRGGKIGALIALFLFAVAALSGADVLAGLFSYLPAGVIQYSPPDNFEKHHNCLRVHSEANWEIRIDYPEGGMPKNSIFSIPIRFIKMGNINIYALGNNGEKDGIYSVGRSDLWQQPLSIHRSIPINTKLKFEADHIAFWLDDDLRTLYKNPPFEIRTLILSGNGAVVEIYTPSWQQEGGKRFPNQRGFYLVDSTTAKELFALAFFLAGVLLLVLHSLARKKFADRQRAGTAPIVLAAFSMFWVISWSAPSPLIIIGLFICLFTFELLVLFMPLAELERQQSTIRFRLAPILFLIALCLTMVSLYRQGLSPANIAIKSFAFTLPFLTVAIYLLVSRQLSLSKVLSWMGFYSATSIGLCAAAALSYPFTGPAGAAIGWAIAGFTAVHFLFANRKFLPFSQPALAIAFLLLLVPLEYSLRFAVESGPIPKLGSFLNANNDWFPDDYLKNGSTLLNFLENPKFQGRTMLIPKPEGEIRIVFLGGSTTYANPYQTSLNFVSLIREAIENDFPGRNVQVYNAGVMGFNSFQIQMLVNDYLSDAGIDLAVLYVRNNDMYQPGLFTYREIWMQMQKGQVSALVQARNFFYRFSLYRLGIAARHILIRHSAFAPQESIARDFKLNIESLRKAVAAQGGQIFVAPELINPMTTSYDQVPLIDSLGAALIDIGHKDHASYIDSSGINIKNWDTNVFTDNVHLTEHGNREVFRLFYPHVRKFVESRLEKP